MVFKQLVQDEITKNIPFILEVPGKEKKGPDKENLDRFKAFQPNM